MTERIGSGPRGNVRNLHEAVRAMRIVSTERADGIADLAAAERARLELLAEVLAEVMKSVPPDVDIFAFSVAGDPPRLWIDTTTHVAMGRDRRTYRFLKDTRLGRSVILETAELDTIADCVTNYVAERIVERERAIEGDWVAAGLRERLVRATPTEAATPAPALPAVPPIMPKRRLWPYLATFLIGAAAGVAGLIALAWVRAGL